MHSNHATSDMWINIDGHCFTCEDGGHEIAAEYICDILYGVNEDDWNWYAGDFLIEHRWIKVTTNSIMLEEYILCGMYDNLYTAQKEALKEWAKDFG